MAIIPLSQRAISINWKRNCLFIPAFFANYLQSHFEINEFVVNIAIAAVSIKNNKQ